MTGAAHHLARAQACLDDADHARAHGQHDLARQLAGWARDHEQIAAALTAAAQRRVAPS